MVYKRNFRARLLHIVYIRINIFSGPLNGALQQQMDDLKMPICLAYHKPCLNPTRTFTITRTFHRLWPQRWVWEGTTIAESRQKHAQLGTSLMRRDVSIYKVYIYIYIYKHTYAHMISLSLSSLSLSHTHTHHILIAYCNL